MDSRSKVTRMPVRPNPNAGAFILGGNGTMLAFATAVLGEEDRVSAHTHGLAQTPLGPAIGDARQNLTLSLAGLLDWLDANFPPEDEHAFVASLRDVELLARVNWRVEAPVRLSEDLVLNPEDVPDELAHALAHPPEALVQCAACRRLCVRDHFIWKERQLCAWDYHRQVFGKRGAWKSQTIEERHFDTVPSPAYLSPPLLEDEGAEVIAAFAHIDDSLARTSINAIIAAEPQRSYIAVRTAEGYSLVRER